MANSVDYIPAKDADFLAWLTNYSTLITAAPTSYGLVAGDATATASALSAFSTALTAATNPSTRTSVTVATKDTARANAVALVRQQVAKIQGTTTVTPTQKTNLGITVRKTTRTPIGPPETRPLLTIVRTNGPVMNIRINDEDTPDTRAFPFGAILCEIWYKAGLAPGTDLSTYVKYATVGRAINQLNVTSIAEGTVMNFICRYTNRRGEPGPQSDVVTQIRSV